MTNLAQRVIMFFIFIPLLLALVILVPWYSHLALQICVILLSVGLAFETAQFCGIWPVRQAAKDGPGRGTPIWRIVAIVACGILPVLVQSLINFSILPKSSLFLCYGFILLWLFASQVVLSQFRDLHQFGTSLFGFLTILAYPSLGLVMFLGLFTLPHPTLILLIFLGAVFFNDTVAYLAGKFLGAGGPRPVKVSPNKTLAGFIGGFLTSPVVMVISCLIEPRIFPAGIGAALLIGCLIGISTIIGDLFESGLKRFSGMKDSGAVILGRGGLMDSVDSLLFSAPVFYYSYILLNHPALLA